MSVECRIAFIGGKKGVQNGLDFKRATCTKIITAYLGNILPGDGQDLSHEARNRDMGEQLRSLRRADAAELEIWSILQKTQQYAKVAKSI